MSAFTLVVGNRNYSSWSLRPWLAMKMAGVAFEEVVIPLRQNTTAAEIARHSPGGKVPALRQGELVIWESIAILEFHCRGVPGGASLATTTRSARRRPRSLGRNARRLHGPAHAHADEHPGLEARPWPHAGGEKDIRRIVALWADCRARFGAGGPFLFGGFGNADAMYAPVVTRFTTYAVTLEGAARAYADAILALPPMREWFAAAKAEPWTIAETDAA